MKQKISYKDIGVLDCELYEELVYQLRQKFPGWDLTDNESFFFFNLMVELVHKTANKYMSPWERVCETYHQFMYDVKIKVFKVYK